MKLHHQTVQRYLIQPYSLLWFTDLFTTGKRDLSVIPEASQENANTSVYPSKSPCKSVALNASSLATVSTDLLTELCLTIRLCALGFYA